MDFKFLFLGAVFLVLSACSSGVISSKIEPYSDPDQEIERVQNLVDEAVVKHYEILAVEDLTKAQKTLERARKYLSDGEKQNDILAKTAEAEGYINRAKKTAALRKPHIEIVVSARELAIKAGSKNDPANNDTLKEIDQDIVEDMDEVADFTPETISKFQLKYLDLELSALKNKYLGKTRSSIQGVKSYAKKFAPISLKTAEIDLKNTENMITAERHNFDGYKTALAKSNQSSQKLIDVLDHIKSTGWKLDEVTAIKLVDQNAQISGLSNNLDKVSAETSKKDAMIKEQSAKLQAASSVIGLQNAIDSAQKQFSPDEAEVYQQGKSVLIRLKTINFDSGSASLPQSAITVLSKVQAVATKLKPKQVVVEGHTDSAGTAAANEKLSHRRAQAVATYLSSGGIQNNKVSAVGFGFKKPIASDRSKEGRSMNRRVDIIITPDEKPEGQ